MRGLSRVSFFQGMAAGGTAACVGRFPGLGSVCLDCSEGQSLVSLPAERLAAVEMRPFGRAIRAGVAAVLVGRALVPALEPERIPAARSARVIEGRLREALGFKGLAIGDDIGMEANPSEAALLGALAGCDLCFAAQPMDALAAAGFLDDAASSGKLPTARFVIAQRRLSSFLAGRKARVSEARSIPNERVERDRAESLTILKGELAFPVGNGRRLVLVFLPPPGSSDAAEIPSAVAALRDGLAGVEIIFVAADPSPSDSQSLADRLASTEGERTFASATVLTYDAHFRPTQEGLTRLVEESVQNLVIIAMRDPYDAAFFPRAHGLVAAYGFSAGGMTAVARLLSGVGKPRGSCPVEVLGLEI